MKEKDKKDVICPLRGHTHKLPLQPDPERPDLVIARCGDRIVHRESRYEYIVEHVAAGSNLITDAEYLQSWTVTKLKSLPEWDEVKSPRPYTKEKIIAAILEIRNSGKSFEYKVPAYKE